MSSDIKYVYLGANVLVCVVMFSDYTPFPDLIQIIDDQL